jgi:hypothetical protein
MAQTEKSATLGELLPKPKHVKKLAMESTEFFAGHLKVASTGLHSIQFKQTLS